MGEKMEFGNGFGAEIVNPTHAKILDRNGDPVAEISDEQLFKIFEEMVKEEILSGPATTLSGNTVDEDVVTAFRIIVKARVMSDMLKCRHGHGAGG